MQEMKENSLVPDRFTNNTAIGACARGGQWRRALEILEGMEVGQEDMLDSIYGITLYVCISCIRICIFERACSRGEETYS
jgi:pentatricopeptide repeat protein